MAIIAYARVSKEDQNLDLQRFALKAAGYDKVFEDEGVSAVATTRPGFEAALAALQPGDTFLVWKNDRAFRSLKDAFVTMEHFRNVGVTFRSLTEFIDTSAPIGRAMFYVLNVFAELEREMIVERTRAGLDAARRSGKVLGRRCKLSRDQIVWAREVLKQPYQTSEGIAQILSVSPRTLRRSLALVAPGAQPHS